MRPRKCQFTKVGFCLRMQTICEQADALCHAEYRLDLQTANRWEITADDFRNQQLREKAEQFGQGEHDIQALAKWS